MPSTTVERRDESVEGHLAAATEYLAIAEAGDAKRAAYEHAADEIIAAKAEDTKLSNRMIGERIGKSDDWVSKLIRWRASGDHDRLPFTGHQEANVRSATRQAARERPAEYVEAFRQAPPEARQAIAREISRAPEVRAEARKRDVEAERARQPSPVSPRTDHTLHEFEGKLFSARRLLREALALVDGIDQPGNDEDVLELLTMVKELAAANDEAYRSGKSLDTWAWELYERSAD